MEPIFHKLSRSRRKVYLVHAFVVLCLLLLGTGDAAGQSHLWSQHFGEADGRGVAVDGLGNVVVTGWLGGTADFGGGPLTSAGKQDVFVAKFDGGGNHVWSQRFGDATAQQVYGVAVDGSGNVVVTGYFQGTVDFGGGPLTSVGYEDIFIAKFDGGGNHLWSQRFGDAGLQAGWGVAVDGSGNVIVTGAFYGTVDFGGGPLTSAGSYDMYDIFVAKLDGGGNHVWSQRFGDWDWQGGMSVAVDGSDNVIVTGYLDGTVDFGGGALTTAGYEDIFVAKFDEDGNHVWSQRFGDGDEFQYGQHVAVDGSGNVIVTGDLHGTVDFGGGPLTSAGGIDIFVAKFDEGGNHVWSQRFGDASSGQRGRSVAVDGSRNVIVTGDFRGTVDFGGGPLTSTSADIFVAKFDEGGNHLWSQRFGDASGQTGMSVAVDGSENVIVTGGFSGTVDFGGGPLTSAGGADIFVAKFCDAPVAVAISLFDARAFDGGVALYSSFTSRLRVLGVNIYRAEDTGRLFLYKKVVHSGEEFYYEDRNIEPGRTYHYRIGVVDQDGEFFSQIATVKAGGYDTVLLPNAPNPFNPETTIRFTLEKAVHVTLAIYNVNGKRVTSLIDDMRAVGPHEARWDGTDAAGSLVSSGVYFCRMSAGKTNLSRRMVLLK